MKLTPEQQAFVEYGYWKNALVHAYNHARKEQSDARLVLLDEPDNDWEKVAIHGWRAYHTREALQWQLKQAGRRVRDIIKNAQKREQQFVTVAIWYDRMDDRLHHIWCFTRTRDEAWYMTGVYRGKMLGKTENWPSRISPVCNVHMTRHEFAAYRLPHFGELDGNALKPRILREMQNPKPSNFVEIP